MIRRPRFVGWPCAERIAEFVVPTGSILVVGGVFAAGLLGPVPLRYVLAWILAGMAVFLELERPSSAFRRGILVGVPTWTVAVSLFCAIVSPLDPPDNDALFRYILLFPLAAVVGALLMYSRHRIWLGRAIVGWALLTSVLALVEFLGGLHLFAGTEVSDRLERDGFTRAVVMAEHPVVLATLLAAALPFLWSQRWRPWVAFGGSALLLCGIGATLSRGGFVLAALFVVTFLVIRRWPRRGAGRPHVRILIALGVLCALVLVLVASDFLRVELLVSDDPETASLQYRLVLYQKILDSLVTHPWGWGLPGLPPGVYLVSSPFGIHDLSVTVDSEVALLAFDAGVLGVLLFVAIFGYLASRWVLRSDSGQAALLLITAGFYLALHAWTGLGLLVLLVLGAGIADDIRRHPSPPGSASRRWTSITKT